jgi:hypothetical protein
MQRIFSNQIGLGCRKSSKQLLKLQSYSIREKHGTAIGNKEEDCSTTTQWQRSSQQISR